MEFRVLGPIELVDDGGARVRLASESQRRLVGLLVSRAGAVLDAGFLEDALGISGGALRTAVSRLRRVVGFDVLVTAPPGYELRSDRIDAVAFERFVADAATATGADRVEALAAAVRLWRGRAYLEFAHEAWAIAEVTRLEELRRDAVERLAESDIEAGNTASAIARLDGLINVHPFADRPRGLLMEALARSGRRPEALRVFADYRRLLAEEVGTEPGEDLVDLDRRVATGMGSSGPDGGSGSQVETAPWRPLPSRLTRLAGRDDQLDVVVELICSERLTTFTGAGGCGKTSLVLEALRRVADGRATPVVWVELASARTGDEVLDLLMAGCGISSAPGTDRLAAVARRLGDTGSVVLAVDNAEHVRVAVAAAVVALLRACSQLRVTVTSRVPLDLVGEVVRRVPSLSVPGAGCRSAAALAASGAGELLLERLAAARPGLDLDADAVAALVSVCRCVEGLPLALELAAGRMRTRSPVRVAEDLRVGLTSLGSSGPDVSERHRTMRSSIAWSVELLDEPERHVLHRLAAFVGPFDDDDVVAVAAGDGAGTAVASSGKPLDRPAVLDALARLVDANLVALDESSGRYRLSDATRQFFQDRTRGSTEDHDAEARHAHWIAEWCLEVGRGRRGIDRGPFQDRMPEVVVATAWARDNDPQSVLDICRGLASMRFLLGYPDDLERTWAWLMAYDRSGSSSADWASATAALLAAATNAGWDLGEVLPEIADRLAPDDVDGRRWVDRALAMGPARRGDIGAALAHARSVVGSGNDLEKSIYAGFAAYMAAMCGLVDDADEIVEDLRRMVRRHDRPFSVDTVGNAHAAAVGAAIARGDRAALSVLAGGSAPADPTFAATSTSLLAHAAVLVGSDPLLARALAWGSTESIPVLRFLRPLDRFHQAMVAGELARAAMLAEQFESAAASLPVPRLHPRALLNVALLETGATSSVQRALDDGDADVAEMPSAPYLELQLLLGRAQLAVERGDGDGARRSAGAAARIAQERGYRFAAVDAAELFAVGAHLEGASADELSLLLAEPLAQRSALGYRAVMVAPRHRYDAALAAVERVTA